MRVAKLDVEKTEEEVFRFIVEFIDENGWAPSYREITDGTSLRSTATTLEYVHRLSLGGYILSGGGARKILVTEKGRKRFEGND